MLSAVWNSDHNFNISFSSGMCSETHRGGQSSNSVELSWQKIRSVCVTVACAAAPGQSHCKMLRKVALMWKQIDNHKTTMTAFLFYSDTEQINIS